jgi:peptidoglycan/LPS O-acetylase OafA/YrhL
VIAKAPRDSITLPLMTVAAHRVRRIAIAGAIIGSAVGGTIATVASPKSGPTFWLDLAVGACVGAALLRVLSAAGGLVAGHLRRQPRSGTSRRSRARSAGR